MNQPGIVAESFRWDSPRGKEEWIAYYERVKADIEGGQRYLMWYDGDIQAMDLAYVERMISWIKTFPERSDA